MASIRKRGNSYYIDYRIAGRRIRKSVGPSKEEAEKELARIEAQQQELKETLPAKGVSLEKAFADFRRYIEELFSPNTQAKYKSILNNFDRFLKERFSSIENISGIKSDVIEQFKAERRKAVAPKTVNAELIILGKLFDLLLNWHYITENPVKSVSRLSEEKRGTPRYLSPQEAKKLLDNASGWLRPILFTFLNTGLRKNELESLEWDDIDFTRRVIKVRAKDEWTPKEWEREVPINDALLKVLQEHRRKVGAVQEPPLLVFPDEHGLKIHHNRLRRHLMRLAKRVGLPDVTQIYILRHTFAAELIKRGADLNTLKNLLGHNDIKTTMIYEQLTKTRGKDAVEGLEF